MRYLMLINLNGEEKQIKAENLQTLCLEFEFNPQVVATALNGDFIPREEREQTELSENDQVEIFAPSQGG